MRWRWRGLAFFVLAGCDERVTAPAGIPEGTRQAIVVTAPLWTSTTGGLQRFERDGERWRPVGRPIAVTVGRTGVAWGPGLHAGVSSEPQKREGDGKSPAGVFRLDTAFGYARAAPQGVRYPYRQATERDYFVDDPASGDYNRWVRIENGKANEPAARWGSFERMRRADGMYELGVVVRYNAEPVAPRRGSAIFLHVWEGPGVPTVGCTAMARDNMLELLRWLDPRRQPVLVQAPAAELGRIQLP
ncbi:MAG: L,D-transpeptidase [Bryobacteraceae bacterium]